MCVAAAIGGAAVLGAGATVYSSNKAASSQRNAAAQANATQQGEFNSYQQDLAPYVDSGNSANNYIKNNLQSLTAPVTMSQQQLEQTPGYQFNLTQGEKAVNNAAAARGLGSSGAALKGAASYATGLADNTYQNQFNNAVTNSTNTYNRLLGVSNQGENAAAGVGNAGLTTGQAIANNTVGAGNATAAGQLGTATGISNGANTAAGGLLTQQYLSQLNGTQPGQYAGAGSNPLYGGYSSQLSGGNSGTGTGFNWNGASGTGSGVM